MAQVNKTGRKILRLVAAGAVTFISLTTCISGVLAWFSINNRINATASSFAIVNGADASLYGVDLIKFDYRKEVYGTGSNQFTAIDYINPQTGAVNRYDYNDTEGTFGKEVSGDWESVEIMNPYDPIDIIITGSELEDLHCLAIYEFTLSSEDMVYAYLNSYVLKDARQTKQEEELFLTTCADFDIFIEDDLDDANFVIEDDPETIEDESDTKPYYPSYFDKSKVLTNDQEIFYKIRYLNSNKVSHPHFYGGSSDEVTLCSNKEVTFEYDSVADTNLLKVYACIDYAPSELEFTSSDIYEDTFTAVYDYIFKFMFVERSGS